MCHTKAVKIKDIHPADIHRKIVNSAGVSTWVEFSLSHVMITPFIRKTLES
jgi:hypothetical protein